MTIALAIKVQDGIVLAADSATTMLGLTANGGTQVANIYNNANKLFNLHKGLPIGALTWGLGNIGPASIATLAKDARQRFTNLEDEWRLDRRSYSVDGVAKQIDAFFCKRYDDVWGQADPSDRPVMPLGFLTAGYSPEADEAQLFALELGPDGRSTTTEVLAGTTGAQWWGQPEAIARILTGLSLDTATALTNLGVDDTQAEGLTQAVRSQVAAQFVSPAMPIQDAIELAEFLVYATVQYVRFTPGNPTVGGPIDIATVTKHEGFKWVARKHFYEAKLNRTT